jgi:CO/xanthine dehydrogenase FAD-binding subunit
MGSYVRPIELAAALQALAEAPRVVVAGATDHYPARVEREPDEAILDISAVDGLRRIVETDAGWRIGALVTWTDVADRDLPPAFDGLRRAARAIGGRQVQNRATVCGNVCNASPAADGVPNLLVLDAAVELASTRGTRLVPLATFITGNRATVRAPDELVTALEIPRPPAGARSTFLKLGARAYLVISIVSVAALIDGEPGGPVRDARIAVGACSPVPVRLGELESVLSGRGLDRSLVDAVLPGHLAGLRPIDDVRAPAAYRLEAAGIMVRRALAELAA